MSAIRFSLTVMLTLSVCRLMSQQVETVVQSGHYLGVNSVAYTTDGKFAITGSSDKTARLWRRSDGREVRSFQGTFSSVVRVTSDLQTSRIMAVDYEGKVTVWDINTGAILLQAKPEKDKFTCAAFNPDGSLFAAGTEKSHIGIYKTASGEKIADLKAVPVDGNYYKNVGFEESVSVDWSADGKLILAGVSDYTAILFDAVSYREIRKFKDKRGECSGCYSEAVLTPDNRLVIVANSDTVKVFDRASGKVTGRLYGQGGTPESLCVSSDGKFVAAVEYGVAELWNLMTGQLVSKTGDYREKKVLAVAISPDSKELLTGNEKRTAEAAAATSGKVLMTFKGYLNQVDEEILSDSHFHWATMVNEARLSPDGKLIAVGRTGNNAKLIDFETGRVYKTLRGHKAMVISLCWSKDGKYLATGGLDGKAVLWDVETGSEVTSIQFHDKKNAIYSVDISNDNKWLITGDWGGYVTIWDVATSKAVHYIEPHGHTGVYQVRLMPNNVYVVSAGLDGKLKMTEIDTRQEIRTFIGHTERINSINLAPDGKRIITASWDGSVRVWDIASGLQERKIQAHRGGVYNAKFDESGRYIISGGDDFAIRLWDAATGQMISEYTGHKGGVGDVNITRDQSTIISGSRDGTVRLWDLSSRKELLSLTFMNEDDWFIRNPEGYFDASEGAFNSISFVKGTEIYAIGQFFGEFFRPGLYTEVMKKGGAGFRQNINQAIEKSPPPTVEFVLPESGGTTENSMAAFMVRVVNNGGGVKELRVLQNGKSQEIDISDLKRMSRAGQEAMKTFDLNLVPGKNEITVTAISNGDIESVPAATDITYSGIPKSSDCYVLSIGINKYENESLNLTYARGDALAFSDFISGRGEKLFNKVNTIKLLDREASKAAIMTALDNIAKKIRKEDVFIFFYAGHGSMVDNNFYFITSEVTGLYQKEKLQSALFVKDLQEKFRQIPALKQVVFIDACQSGSSVEALAMRGGAEEKALAQLSRSSGIHVLASSESQQQSAEIKSLNHGVFTYVLLEALGGKADGAPADSKITVYELKSYIDDQVPEISYRLIRHKQFPSTFSIGHDFPIVME